MVKITNSNQFRLLVLELENNPALAKGANRWTNTANFKEQWENIATKLNALGPPKRDGDGWQRVWRDLKCKVKRKIKTGEESYQELSLSPLETQVANLIKFVKQLNTKSNIKANVQQSAEMNILKIEDSQSEIDDDHAVSAVSEFEDEVIDDMSVSTNERSQHSIDGNYVRKRDFIPRKLTNSKQFWKLVSELERNPALARGFKRNTTPSDFKEQWEDIATKLNALGPPIRESDGWQNVWRDLKCKVKRKTVPNKKKTGASKEKSYKQLSLNPLEERVVNLLHFGNHTKPYVEVANVDVEHSAVIHVLKAEDPLVGIEETFVVNEVSEIENEVVDDDTSSSINEWSLSSGDESVVKKNLYSRKMTNSNQFAKLVSEIEKKPALATGFNKGMGFDFKEQWEDIATKLNALGPPIREAEAWQKVWRYLKSKVRKRIFHIKPACHPIGAESYIELALDPLEQQVANLLQSAKQLNSKEMSKSVPNITKEFEVDQAVIGLSEIKCEETDYNTSASVNEFSLHSVDETFAQNDDTIGSTSRRNNNFEPRQQQRLDENHSGTQERMLTQMSTSLAELADKIGSVEKHLNNASYNLQKLVQIEENKLKIMQRQQEREEALYKTEMKLKRMKMEIKGKELNETAELRDVIINSSAKGMALDQEKMDQYIKTMSLTGSEKENAEKLAAMWMYAAQMGSSRNLAQAGNNRPIMLIPAGSTSMLATPPPPVSPLPGTMVVPGISYRPGMTYTLPYMRPNSVIYAPTGSLPGGLYHTHKSSKSAGPHHRRRRPGPPPIRMGKMHPNRRQRRKSEADILDNEAFQYTGLDRDIADNFLARQEQTNSQPGSTVDYSSSSASETYGKQHSGSSSKTKIVCRDVRM